MVVFTESAINILKQSVDPPDLIRIAVVGGGCSGFMYDMAVEEKPSPNDVVLDLDNLRVCLDPQSAFMLSETTVDYETTLAQSGFKFLNEQATRSCGCGKSFSCG
jgi:iron-sulfur cluster assembly accessory protein